MFRLTGVASAAGAASPAGSAAGSFDCNQHIIEKRKKVNAAPRTSDVFTSSFGASLGTECLVGIKEERKEKVERTGAGVSSTLVSAGVDSVAGAGGTSSALTSVATGAGVSTAVDIIADEDQKLGWKTRQNKMDERERDRKRLG